MIPPCGLSIDSLIDVLLEVIAKMKLRDSGAPFPTVFTAVTMISVSSVIVM